MLDRQLHLLLDGPTHSRLAREATARRISVGELVRTAIARELSQQPSNKEGALKRLMSAPRISVPKSPEQLRKLIDSRHERI